MNKFFSKAATVLLASFAVISCDSENEAGYNPFDEAKTGELLPTSIIIKKETPSVAISESWTNIGRDSLNRIVSYDYNYDINSNFSQSEKSNCKIFYYTDHLGKDIISTRTELEYSKADNSIKENYRQTLWETITLNNSGYINKISTTIAHFDEGAAEPVMKTSERTFTYDGSYCVSSIYQDDDCKITYTYDWNVYQLNGATVLKENYTDGSIESTSYTYKYDTEKLYTYSGTDPLPFIQKSFPSIFASMGYTGRCTPYVLAEETQSGRINFDKESFSTTSVHNTFYLEGDIDSKLKYTAISDVYNPYDVLFIK